MMTRGISLMRMMRILRHDLYYRFGSYICIMSRLRCRVVQDQLA